jgi:hypothetical protein
LSATAGSSACANSSRSQQALLDAARVARIGAGIGRTAVPKAHEVIDVPVERIDLEQRELRAQRRVGPDFGNAPVHAGGPGTRDRVDLLADQRPVICDGYCRQNEARGLIERNERGTEALGEASGQPSVVDVQLPKMQPTPPTALAEEGVPRTAARIWGTPLPSRSIEMSARGARRRRMAR